MKRFLALALLLSSSASAQLPPTNVSGLDFNTNGSQAVSGGGHIRLRNNGSALQQSINGAPYVNMVDGLYLPLAGGTMSGSILSSQGTEGNWTFGGQLQGGSATLNNWFKYTPTDTASDPLYINNGKFFASQVSRPDEVWNMGWNLAPGGGRMNSGALHGALGIQLEQYFEGSDNQMEFELLYVDPANTQHRPMFFNANLASPYGVTLTVGAETVTMIGSSVGGSGGQYSVNATRARQQSPSGVYYQNIDDTAVVVSGDTTSGATLFAVQAGGTNKYTFNSDGQMSFKVINQGIYNSDYTMGILFSTSSTIGVESSHIKSFEPGNFDIGTSGGEWRTARFLTSVLTPKLDIQSAGTLNIGTTTATAILMGAQTTIAPAAVSSGSPSPALTVTPAAHTALAASVEYSAFVTTSGVTEQFATGALTNERSYVFNPITYGFIGASTVSNSATVYIAGPPIQGTNATLTQASNYGLWVEQDGIGTNMYVGIHARNATAAANGAQQYGPIIESAGQGWGSGGSTSTRQGVGFQAHPIQGGSASTRMDIVIEGAGGGAFSNTHYFSSAAAAGDFSSTSDLATNLGGSTTRWNNVWGQYFAYTSTDYIQISSNNITFLSASSRWQIDGSTTGGDFFPTADNITQIGNTTHRISVLYSDTSICEGCVAAPTEELVTYGNQHNYRPSTPSAPTLTGAGASGGATTWAYHVTCINAAGTATAKGSTATTTVGAATLDAGSPIIITWVRTAGCVKYTVVRETAGGTPNTTGQISAVGGITGLTLTDSGLSAAAFTDGTAAAVVAAANAVFASNVQLQRVSGSSGTALANTDFTVGSGWGSTASIGTLRGTDTDWEGTVSTAGISLAANPTLVLTFKDGTWTAAPVCIVEMSATSDATNLTSKITWTTSATALTITMNGTPVVTNTFVFSTHCIGTN